jgi:acetate kinase
MKPAQASILTVNGGSSSIKFALFRAGTPPQRILEGSIERIGLPAGVFAARGADPADTFTRPSARPTTRRRWRF